MAIWFRSGTRALATGTSWTSGVITATLHSSTLAPSLEWANVSQLTASELATGSGYTVGGKVLAGCTATYTTANSWTGIRANSAAVAVGDLLRPNPGNGFIYRVIVAGTTAASYSAWGTSTGTVVTDGTAQLELAGGGVLVLDAANPQWTTATFAGVRYLVLSERTSGTAASQPLLGYIDFVTDRTGQGGTFEVDFAAQGVLQIVVP